MTEEEKKQKELVDMIRKIAREEANEVLDEHLEDFVHTEKPVEDSDVFVVKKILPPTGDKQC